MPFKTYGELRRQLAQEGIKWTVNPALSDNKPIVRPPLGADLTHYPQAKAQPVVDVAALVRAKPTTNTLLRSHLTQRGLLPASPLRGSSGAASTAASAEAAGSGGPPTSVDWRNRWGWSFVTPIRDQDPCEHCWIYAPTALVECMVRIEHCVWCERSEGDYIEANKVPCGQCGDPTVVLGWIAGSGDGICDLQCVPWVDADPGNRSGPYWNPPPTGCGTGSMLAPPAYAPPSNRDGRTVKIPAYTALGDINSQKNWIDSIGPLVVGFEVYSDFYGWSGNTPYMKSPSATAEGSHIMLAIGYDDHLKCWIVKNSWGPTWGNGGFGLIGYGQCNIDSNAKLGFQYSNPDPWTKRLSHSGGMIESGDGALHRNFELLAPSAGNSFTHWWRDNSSSALPWHKAEVLSNDVASAPTFTGTTYNRNFETIYRTVHSQLRHYWFDQAAQKWNAGVIFGPNNAIGEVGFTESSYGIGNFEVVVAVQGGKLEHWWRAGSTWHQGPTFGANIASGGPSLIESTYGNLELIAVLSGGQMQHWWRNGNTWTNSATFGSGIKSPPCMIQGEFGTPTVPGNGNFELCVATPTGAIEHWWRNNQVTSLPWQKSVTFGQNIARVISLLQGSFGFNLELIAQLTDGNLQHYWRDDGGWHAGVVIGPAALTV
jgi:Papain family cysteine protease